jgi:hypothetical protein
MEQSGFLLVAMSLLDPKQTLVCPPDRLADIMFTNAERRLENRGGMLAGLFLLSDFSPIYAIRTTLTPLHTGVKRGSK